MNKRIHCVWCGQPAHIIWVHGHGQCSVCGTNTDECCRGERSADPDEDHCKNSS